jgi:hypothetical protein
VTRDFDGKLFSGHKSFEWLRGVFLAVMSAQQTIPAGMIAQRNGLQSTSAWCVTRHSWSVCMGQVRTLRVSLHAGHYLWELIHPKDPKDGSFVKPASGKYRIKLFVMVRSPLHLVTCLRLTAA